MKLPENISDVINAALAEDVGNGDLTAKLIPAGQTARASIVVREEAILCGSAWVDTTFRALDGRCEIEWLAHDGEQITAGQKLCRLQGQARALLTGERTALNFLQTLSGTATRTRRYADQLRGTKTQLLDTRKTIPGLRAAQKYAVRCGGGTNHRIGLFDGILIKENHIEAAGSIAAAIGKIRAVGGGLPIEIEVESLADLEAAIVAGADICLLDNFTNAEMRAAVGCNAGRIKLEASGGFELEDLAPIAATGVDYISVGALTKHLNAIDLSMRFETNDSAL